MQRLGRNGCVRQSVEQGILRSAVSFVPAKYHATILTSSGIVDASDVVHATDDEVQSIRRPREVVYLCTARPTHVLCSPGLLVLQTVGSKRSGVEVILRRYPENDIAVVAGGSEKLA